MPLVSIILTTYNREEFLKETINSILNQTFKDFELIVIDQFSSYNIFEVISNINDHRISLYQNNRDNNIISVNRNFGIKKSKGEYICFCDDDDIWLIDKLENQITYIKNNNIQPPFLIHTNTILISDLKKYNNINTKKYNPKSFNDLICNNQITYSSVILSKSNLIHFDENPLIRASEDYALWFELFNNGYKFFLLETPSLKYRVTSNSASFGNRQFNALRVIYITINMLLKYKPNDINILILFKRINLELIKYLYNKFKYHK